MLLLGKPCVVPRTIWASDLGIIPEKTGFDVGWAWRLPDPKAGDEGNQ